MTLLEPGFVLGWHPVIRSEADPLREQVIGSDPTCA